MPFLVKHQEEALATQARKEARNLQSVIERHRLLLSYVGNSPEIVSLVMGYVSSTDSIQDQFRSMLRPDALSWISLHDVVGDEIVNFTLRPEDRNAVSDSDVEKLLLAVVDEKPDGRLGVIYQSEQGISRVVLVVPVLSNGFVEGALVGGFRLNQNEIFRQNEIAREHRIVPVREDGSVEFAPNGSKVATLDNANLAVVLIPDTAATSQAAQAVLTNVAGAVGLVLTAAFALFAALGRRALIEPHKKLERQKQSMSELAAIAERANDSIMVCDLNARIVWTNPAFERLTGYSSVDIIGKSPFKLLHGPDTDRKTAAAIIEAAKARVPIKTEILNYTIHGHPHWVSITVSPLRDEKGEFFRFATIANDVTEARRQRDAIISAKKEIEHQALHDPLTGLPNRRALDAAIQERTGHGATLIRIDLDHFKYINDTLGHEAGDFALCEVARILREETSEADLPVRVGGDEFVIFMGQGKGIDDAEALAEQILVRIREPKIQGSKTIRFGASFGVASTQDDLLTLDQLIVGADAALYEAKDMGRNRVRRYSKDLHHQVLDRRSLAREIRLAIAREEFVPYFQPQFCARTRAIVGVETLVRWASPTLGLVMPDKFLPVARQLSAIEDIDGIIFEKALRDIDFLNRQGFDIPKVSFNVTAERVSNPDLFTAVLKHQVGRPKIAFEILESVLIEDQSELFRFSLDRLREMGVSIEVDDFGSGHASILGLMHLMPDVMKIDKELVLPITESDTALGLMRQVVGMADLMGLKITAEGVETLEHADILADLGCDTLQGYAFTKPLSTDDLATFLRTYEAKNAVVV
jgi:diguanylate cyclase (GGDEF)-like protein/PAS domain S-box-containing protein